MKQSLFSHQVVDSIPEKLQANTLYVTTDEDVAAHLCACGCGREVVTPLSPTDWSITLDRRGASLSPSIGNWAFPCRSHYFIWDGSVVWARNMTDEAIAHGRGLDSASKQRYYERLRESTAIPRALERPSPLPTGSAKQTVLAWWMRLFGK